VVSARQTSPLARIRRSSVLGSLGVLVALWCWLGLPGLHVLEHAHEDQPPSIVYGRNGVPRPARLQALIDEVLYGRTAHAPARPHDEGHRHSHDPGSPGDERHGGGSLQHFAVAFAASPTFVLVPTPGLLAQLRVGVPDTQPKAPGPWRLRHPRGPPLSAVAI
jgi:hypothetical protein